jgi:hypothetical protein
MSEHPIDGNISLKNEGDDAVDVTDNFSQVEPEEKTDTNTNNSSVDGYTLPKNESNLEQPKITNVIDRYLAYYIKKKIALKNRALIYKKNTRDVSKYDIQTGRRQVKGIIHGSAGQFKNKLEKGKIHNIGSKFPLSNNTNITKLDRQF